MKSNHVYFNYRSILALVIGACIGIIPGAYANSDNDDVNAQLACPCDFSLQQFKAEQDKAGINPIYMGYCTIRDMRANLAGSMIVPKVEFMITKGSMYLQNGADLTVQSDNVVTETKGSCSQSIIQKDVSQTFIQQHSLTSYKQYLACQDSIKALAANLGYQGCK